MLYKVLYNVKRINKVNFKLKNQNGRIMKATTHAGDLMKVKGERPQVFSMEAMKNDEREQGFEKWCREWRQTYEAESKDEQ